MDRPHPQPWRIGFPGLDFGASAKDTPRIAEGPLTRCLGREAREFAMRKCRHDGELGDNRGICPEDHGNKREAITAQRTFIVNRWKLSKGLNFQLARRFNVHCSFSSSRQANWPRDPDSTTSNPLRRRGQLAFSDCLCKTLTTSSARRPTKNLDPPSVLPV